MLLHGMPGRSSWGHGPAAAATSDRNPNPVVATADAPLCADRGGPRSGLLATAGKR
ncbi:MAG: hypothetical protein PQJ48_10445 [Sphaerochaetaceae bacterium]|nr:hypothetical protein [Sphaerochaetaceae bacterium]